jgi:endonuclease/exonuclease/phosphatase (EEP) superfamily protein YafD
MLRRLAAAVVLLVAVAVLFVLTWPQLLGLQKTPIIAQAISFRGAIVAAGVIALALLIVPVLLSRRFRRFGGSLAALLLIFVLANVAVLSTRGFGTSPTAAAAADEDITVLSWNTLGDAPGAGAIAALARESGADVVTLPETSKETADAVAGLLRQAGRPMQVLNISLSPDLKARSTSMLISTTLGRYHADTGGGSTSTLPSVIAVADNGTSPTIVAVHAVAPIPSELARWRADLLWVSGTCTGKNIILSGDFNSTIDHLAGLGSGAHTLGACTDAGLQTGNGAVGTWPTKLPPLLGAPIDHVMSGDDWKATGMHVVQTLDRAGSDHRPIVVRLSRTSG